MPQTHGGAPARYHQVPCARQMNKCTHALTMPLAARAWQPGHHCRHQGGPRPGPAARPSIVSVTGKSSRAASSPWRPSRARLPKAAIRLGILLSANRVRICSCFDGTIPCDRSNELNPLLLRVSAIWRCREQKGCSVVSSAHIEDRNMEGDFHFGMRTAGFGGSQFSSGIALA